MDRIKSHLIPVLIVGAVGTVVYLVVFAIRGDLPSPSLDLATHLVHSALAAQIVALPVLACVARFRQPAVFGLLIVMSACLWGPFEYMIGATTGWWLDDGAEFFVQEIVVPAVFATYILVTGRPKALFSSLPSDKSESPAQN